MTENEIHTLTLIANLASIPALLLSLWNFVEPRLRRIKVKIIPEDQVQLQQQTNPNEFGRPECIFNCFIVVTASGPDSKWEVIKFEKAMLHTPDGRIITFECFVYLKEEGVSQIADSRRVPFALRGGDSTTVIPAFRSSELTQWILGKYTFELVVLIGRSKKISVSGLSFTLIQKDLNFINRPKAIYIKKLD